MASGRSSPDEIKSWSAAQQTSSVSAGPSGTVSGWLVTISDHNSVTLFPGLVLPVIIMSINVVDDAAGCAEPAALGHISGLARARRQNRWGLLTTRPFSQRHVSYQPAPWTLSAAPQDAR
jgi:hypothetical protein